MKTKNLAKWSLIGMGIGFVTFLCLPNYPVIEVMKGAFEAGLVGGFADWFAVTALFRHPLGLRIPHTSLLLANRDQITKSFIYAIENELLAKESISKKIKQLHLIDQLGTSLVHFLSSRKRRIKIGKKIRSGIAMLPIEKLTLVVQDFFKQAIVKLDLASLTSTGVKFVQEERWDEHMINYGLQQIDQWILKPDSQNLLGEFAYRALLNAKSDLGGMKGFAMIAISGWLRADKLGPLVQQWIHRFLVEMQQENNAARCALQREIQAQLKQLPHDTSAMNSLQNWLEKQISNPVVSSQVTRQLQLGKRHLLALMDQEIANGGKHMIKGLQKGKKYLGLNPQFLEQVEQKVLDFICQIIAQNHYRLGRLIKDNLSQMNDQELVDMLEEKIGSDLQWIRVNGALCGFLLGSILSLVRILL